MSKTSGNYSITTNAGSNTLVSEAKYTNQRTVIIITNTEATGGNTAYIYVGDEASAAGKGIPLLPTQSINFSADAGYKPSNDRINAFCAAAITLAVYEELD